MTIPSIQALTERALHAPTLASVLKAAGATVQWSGPMDGHATALVTLDGRAALVAEAPGGVRVHPLTPADAVAVPLDLHGAAWDATVAALRRALANG
jgi:hypothetical protein